MNRYHARTLVRDDFPRLMALEERLFGGCHEGVLGPYYVRLCCDFFAESCFVVEHEGEIVGYLLAFVRGREAYCTTMAVLREHQGTRALIALLASFVEVVIDRVDSCWFTVEADNRAARSVHAILGARDERIEPDFYGPGRPRIIARIDRGGFSRALPRLARLGIARTPASAHAPAPELHA
ncbi:MAG: GNAT family N-acetyltransferase [Nannocystaceae bacterium]